MNRRSLFKSIFAAPIAAVFVPIPRGGDHPPTIGNYGGIDRATSQNEWWTFSNEGAGRPLTEQMLIDHIKLLRDRPIRVFL